MNFSHPVSTCPVDLARTIAALANSGGGECRIEGEHGPGRELLGAALREIVPPPTIIDATGVHPPQERSVLKTGIVCPPQVTVSEDERGIIVTVAPGESLCTVGGTVVVIEDGAIQTLGIRDVIRRAGSGG
ncbi:hypothetical protein [Methanogenium cariaci]|jgi:hypothetical protein